MRFPVISYAEYDWPEHALTGRSPGAFNEVVTVHKRRRLTGFAAAGAVGALVLAACVPDQEGADEGAANGLGFEGCEDDPTACNIADVEQGGEIIWLINDDTEAWSAFSPEGGSVYTQQMLSGVLPSTGQWLPDAETYEYNMDLLAAEPELLSEGDPFQYQFEFSPDAVWNDGTPVTAWDMIISWMMATGEEDGHCEGCRSRAPGDYVRIESIEAEDDGATAVVTLKEEEEANPEWFGLFSAHSLGGGMYPAHIAVEEGFIGGDADEPDLDDAAGIGEYFDFTNETMPYWSAGPYQIVEGTLGDQVIKEPNPEWYGEEDPNLETVIMQFNTEEPSYVPALTNGELHGGNPAQYNEDVIQQLEGMDNVHLDVSPGASWEHIDLDLQNEWLQDHALRLAIFTAIDAQEIVDRNFGGGFPEGERSFHHMFPPDNPYFQDILSDTGQGSGDVDLAMEILEDAGYELEGAGDDAGGGVLTLDGEQVGPFRLRATDTDTRQTSLQIIQGHLGDIGIETELEPIEVLGEVLAEGEYDIVQYGWSGNPFIATAPHQQWHSASSSNWGGLENDEVDELVEAVQTAPDLDTAAQYVNEAAELVVDEAYVLPLMWEPEYTFVTDTYANVRPHMHSSERATYGIGEWGVLAQ